jgi:hypothetical protein
MKIKKQKKLRNKRKVKNKKSNINKRKVRRKNINIIKIYKIEIHNQRLKINAQIIK